jgi:hypothetical protein
MKSRIALLLALFLLAGSGEIDEWKIRRVCLASEANPLKGCKAF